MDYDLVLHIGAPKAGSSAIQAFLVSNRAILEKAGYCYPEHGLDINQVSGGHSQQFGVKLINGELAGAAECLAGWLATAREKNLCLLLSAEAFYRQAEKLKELTSGLRVKVLAYFRDPVESMISSYNQSVKRHYNTQKFTLFAKQQFKSKMVDKSGEIFKVWLEYFGKENVQVLPYDKKTFSQKKMEWSFLEALGVPHSLTEKFVFRNQLVNASYTPSALELKRLLNVVLDREDPKMNHRTDWPLQKYSDGSSEIRPTAEELLGADLYMAFTRKFKPTNEFMKTQILDFCPEGFLEYPVSNTGRWSGGAVPAVSLQQVMIEAFADQLDTVEYVFQRVIARLTDGKVPPPDVKLLAEILNIDMASDDLAHTVFDPTRMNFPVSLKRTLPEGLRKIELLLKQNNLYDLVVALIQRILKL